MATRRSSTSVWPSWSNRKQAPAQAAKSRRSCNNIQLPDWSSARWVTCRPSRRKARPRRSITVPTSFRLAAFSSKRSPDEKPFPARIRSTFWTRSFASRWHHSRLTTRARPWICNASCVVVSRKIQSSVTRTSKTSRSSWKKSGVSCRNAVLIQLCRPCYQRAVKRRRFWIRTPRGCSRSRALRTRSQRQRAPRARSLSLAK